MLSASSSKHLSRQKAKQIRQSLDMVSISQSIRMGLTQVPQFQKASKVLIFYPMPGEVNLMDLVEKYPEKQWYLPTMNTDETINFYRYQAEDTLFVHPWGVQEPSTEKERWDGEASHSVLCLPALVYTLQGHRLGYGKGYYDRFLAGLLPEHVPFKIGPIPETLIWEQLPLDPWDLPVDCLVTEQRSILTSDHSQDRFI